MSKTPDRTRFEAKLQRPLNPGSDEAWTFVVLPKEVSGTLPRRGRTTVDGTLNGHPFQTTLEPDGQLSHWLKVDETLRKASNTEPGDTVTVEITPVRTEVEPRVPTDFMKALKAHPDAKTTWDATTVLARIDWIHWIESAKQQKTRNKRVADACDMLGSGKKRVCCFDNSGYYSKSLSAPEATE